MTADTAQWDKLVLLEDTGRCVAWPSSLDVAQSGWP